MSLPTLMLGSRKGSQLRWGLGLLAVIGTACVSQRRGGGATGRRTTAPSRDPAVRVSFTPIPLDGRGLAAESTVVVSDTAAWSKLWAAIETHSPPQPAPGVDFVAQRVIVIGSGRRPTTGYLIGVDSVYTLRDTLVIAAWEREPNPAKRIQEGMQLDDGPCWLGMAVTHPAIAIGVPRTPAPVRATFRKIYGC